jgi:hypothetical protein
MMKKLSSSTRVLTALWIIYAIVATYVFYQAMEPLKRELIGILGGFALALVVGTALAFTPPQRRRFFDGNSSESAEGQELSCATPPNGNPGSSGKPSASCSLVRPTE